MPEPPTVELAGSVIRRTSPCCAVLDEVSGLLSTVSGEQMSSAAALFTDRAGIGWRDGAGGRP